MISMSVIRVRLTLTLTVDCDCLYIRLSPLGNGAVGAAVRGAVIVFAAAFGSVLAITDWRIINIRRLQKKTRMAVDVYGYAVLATGIVTAFLFAATLVVLIVFVRRQSELARSAAYLPFTQGKPIVVEEVGCTPFRAFRVMYILTAIGVTTVLITSVALNYLHAAIGIVILALMWSFVWLLNLSPGKTSTGFTATVPAALSVSETFSRFRIESLQKVRNRPLMLFGGIVVICGCSFILLYSLWGLCLDMYTGMSGFISFFVDSLVVFPFELFPFRLLFLVHIRDFDIIVPTGSTSTRLTRQYAAVGCGAFHVCI